MAYRVIVRFKDLKDGNRLYEVGAEYPRPGVKVSKERLNELATDLNRRKIPLIELVQEEPEKQVKTTRRKANTPKD